MNDIFKNAYFGKSYKTRDGRKVIYLGDNSCWIEGGKTEIGYSNNGLFVDFQEHGIDIVSEWQEEINEDELDKLAESKAFENGKVTNTSYHSFVVGYKIGYRKAKEE